MKSSVIKTLMCTVLASIAVSITTANSGLPYQLVFGEKGASIKTIKAAKADSLLKQHFYIKDTKSNKTMPVLGFELLYAERGLFEDSTGRPIILTEYYQTQSPSDTVAAYFLRSLQDMYKPGDTIKIQNIFGKVGDKYFNVPNHVIVIE